MHGRLLERQHIAQTVHTSALGHVTSRCQTSLFLLNLEKKYDLVVVPYSDSEEEWELEGEAGEVSVEPVVCPLSTSEEEGE